MICIESGATQTTNTEELSCTMISIQSCKLGIKMPQHTFCVHEKVLVLGLPESTDLKYWRLRK